MTAENISRENYVNGRCSHEEYYRAVYNGAGLQANPFSGASVEECRALLAAGDEHLNRKPLGWWDAFHGAYGRALAAGARKLGDGAAYCFANTVCAMKQRMRDVIEGRV